MLKIKNLSKQYNGKTILDHIDLTISEGSITLLLGQSGVGKSTVLRILTNLEQADTGSVTLNDKPLTKKDVGMVFQHFNLFEHLTVLENITLPLIQVQQKDKAEAVAIAQKLLQDYSIADKSNLYPRDLSGGQKQRVAFARTLAMQPKILCLDEPTSALDPALTSKVGKNINALAQAGYIVIIATHDTDLIKQINCTIHLMEQGKIIQSATSKELANQPNEHLKIKNFTHG